MLVSLSVSSVSVHVSIRVVLILRQQLVVVSNKLFHSRQHLAILLTMALAVLFLVPLSMPDWLCHRLCYPLCYRMSSSSLDSPNDILLHQTSLLRD